MEVSENESKKAMEPGGPELIETVVSLTGLPEPLMHLELERILGGAGHNKQDVTLDQLRQALAIYLEMTMKDELADEEMIFSE